MQDRLALDNIGVVNHDAAVEPSRTQERRVQDVRPVCGSEDDDVGVRVKPVHLHQQGIQRLLALIMPAAQTGAPQAPNRIQLVDEHDGRQMLLRLRKQVANPGRTHAHEHLHEVRAADVEERNAGLTGYSASQQSLAAAWGAHQEHAARDLGAKRAEALGVAQEVHDLL